jgi:hypothetical protein
MTLELCYCFYTHCVSSSHIHSLAVSLHRSCFSSHTLSTLSPSHVPTCDTYILLPFHDSSLPLAEMMMLCCSCRLFQTRISRPAFLSLTFYHTCEGNFCFKKGPLTQIITVQILLCEIVIVSVTFSHNKQNY